MSKTWLIFKNELITTLTRRSFLITLFLVPAVSAIIAIVIAILGRDTTQVVSQIFTTPVVQPTEGYVDLSGIIQSLPADVPENRLSLYPDVASARQALADGKISAYYVVPADYLQTGDVTYVRSDFNPLSGFDESTIFEDVLRYNLLGQDSSLVERIDKPYNLQVINQNPEPQRDQGDMFTFFLPYIVTMMFYVVILASASLMLNSMTKEKENRVIEILMNSVTPPQLLTGKIFALGLAGLLQTVVWTGAGMALLRLSGQTLEMSAAFQLPVSILGWGVVFFLLGFAVYASLMAGVGAMVPNLREASQATTLMVIPMVVPLTLLSMLINEPNGALAVGLSLFPLTAPVTMMTRLSISPVPLWQLLAAIALLAVTAYLIIRGISAMFRAQVLLSGQPFEMKAFFQNLLGKA